MASFLQLLDCGFRANGPSFYREIWNHRKDKERVPVLFMMSVLRMEKLKPIKFGSQWPLEVVGSKYRVFDSLQRNPRPRFQLDFNASLMDKESHQMT